MRKCGFFVLLPLLVLCLGASAQEKKLKYNFAGMQFGGQALYGLSYDRTFLAYGNFGLLNLSLGAVINENADDQDPEDRPIYGLNLGLSGLVKIKSQFIEIGGYSSPYFYKSYTFFHQYAWLGVRFLPKKLDDFFIAVAWTPSIRFSKPPPMGYNDLNVGVKVGLRF